MMAKTKLGRLRGVLTGMSARELVEVMRANGSSITLRRLRAIELGEVQATATERQEIATALGIESYEVTT